MKVKKLFTLACIVCFGTSCQKNKPSEPPTDVAIVVTSPQNGSIYQSGDSVYVSATVNYNGILHGYEVLVTDSTTGSVIHNIANHIHTNQFTINTAFSVIAPKPLVLKLNINTHLDHTGQNASKIIYFRYTP